MYRLLYLFGDSVASTSEVYLSIVFFRMVVNFSSFVHAQHALKKQFHL